MRGWSARPVPLWAIVSVAGIVAALVSLMQLPSAQILRERAFDRVLAITAPAPRDEGPIVVDIDRTLLERFGPWPWSRERLATLLTAIADGKPRVVGLDVVLVGSDERSAGSLARQLAEAAAEERVRRLAMSLADELPDVDRLLAEAIGRVPSALGLALDSDGEDDLAAATPILMQGRPDLSRLWQEARAIGPSPAIARAAAGLGVLALPGDQDARVRRLPMLVVTGRGLRPGLALEVVRLSHSAGSYLVSARGPVVRTGGTSLRLGADGMLRLRPVSRTRHDARVRKASRILDDAGARAELAGRVVLVGSAAPEIGGLRPGADGDLVASVQLHADAAEQLLAGDVPSRPASWLSWTEAVAALALAAIAVWAGLVLSPGAALALVAGLAAAWTGAVMLVAGLAGLLVDPLLPPAALAVGWITSAAVTAARVRRREATIRRRFEQHLAPAVVARIVARPDLLKLEGEAREITALFTDIEGFTSLTERAGPAELIRLLDRYIEGASRIVVEHGGMVEKIVGDGLHAIFNAPLDLGDHPTKALDCALALLAFASAMQEEPDARRLGFGRTRIGIETGTVIVGDVGGGRRLDYTAHGNAMNRAARLEAANKELGSAICIGPETARRIAADRLEPLGEIALRGVADRLAVFTPRGAPRRRAPAGEGT